MRQMMEEEEDAARNRFGFIHSSGCKRKHEGSYRLVRRFLP
jgi:hypothetical protein